MRTVLLANNALGARVARWLCERGELVGLVVHEEALSKHVDRLGAELGVPTWEWPDGLDQVRQEAPDCLLSVLFRHRLPPTWLRVPAWRAINLHPGYLPYNGGANPNVWPLVDGSPAGTTLHVMAEQIDAGPIIVQRRVDVSAEDTAATLYRKLEVASFELLVETWPDIRSIAPAAQPDGGTYHRASELRTLDPTIEDLALIDRLRARTFPPFGAEFERDGRRWLIRVEIQPVDEVSEHRDG